MARRFPPTRIALASIGVLMTVLALDSARNSYRYAATTQHVLNDYAALGAEGVTSRLQATLATRFVQLLGAVSANGARRDSALETLPAPAAAVARMIVWSGRLAGDSAVVTMVRDSSFGVPRALGDSVRAVRLRIDSTAYLGAFAAGEQFVVFAPNRSSAGAPVFALRMDSLSQLLARNVAADAVLPRALTRGERLGNRIGVLLRVQDRTLVRRGIDTSAFHARSELGPMLASISVDVFLDESLAPLLVIGGVPASRVPFLLTAVALTAALVGMMALQLRQRDRLARLREDFVASTSHELRTPLSQIRLFAETLRLERVRSVEERDRALAVIERESRRLEHLVDNMLHASRVDRGALQLSPERVDVSALTNEVVADFQPLAEKHAVRVCMERGAPLYAPVDSNSWRQIVINLLDNAVRYGGRDTTVDVTVGERGGNVRMQVVDDGPGIASADRERAWERFWRGDAGRSSGIAGAGIGLATVRELVKAHGGRCWVQESSHGVRGATMVVEVPIDGIP